MVCASNTRSELRLCREVLSNHVLSARRGQRAPSSGPAQNPGRGANRHDIFGIVTHYCRFLGYSGKIVFDRELSRASPRAGRSAVARGAEKNGCWSMVPRLSRHRDDRSRRGALPVIGRLTAPRQRRHVVIRGWRRRRASTSTAYSRVNHGRVGAAAERVMFTSACSAKPVAAPSDDFSTSTARRSSGATVTLHASRILKRCRCRAHTRGMAGGVQIKAVESVADCRAAGQVSCRDHPRAGLVMPEVAIASCCRAARCIAMIFGARATADSPQLPDSEGRKLAVIAGA